MSSTIETKVRELVSAIVARVERDVEEAQVLQFAEILVGAVTGRPPKSGDERKLDFER